MDGVHPAISAETWFLKAGRIDIADSERHRLIDEIAGWIEAMPPGWCRENTLAAMVQSNANFQKYEEAHWALVRIQSPHFRKQGEKRIAGAEARSK